MAIDVIIENFATDLREHATNNRKYHWRLFPVTLLTLLPRGAVQVSFEYLNTESLSKHGNRHLKQVWKTINEINSVNDWRVCFQVFISTQCRNNHACRQSTLTPQHDEVFISAQYLQSSRISSMMQYHQHAVSTVYSHTAAWWGLHQHAVSTV